MVEETVKTYHVAYERDASGWWVASVRGLRGCHTQGRTVDEARRRIREAMSLFIDNARTAKIVDNVKLPADARRRLAPTRSSERRPTRATAALPQQPVAPFACCAADASR